MSPYMKLRLKNDRDSLTSSLRNTAEALRINFPGYTSEVRYTDRVLRFPSLFSAGFAESKGETINIPNPSLLYSSASGDPGGAGYFPLNAVRWLTPSRNIAAIVTKSAGARFEAELFCFDAKPRPMSAEFYLLDPGSYKLTITAEDKERRQGLQTHDLTVEGRRTRVSFTLPARRLCVLSILPNGV